MTTPFAIPEAKASIAQNRFDFTMPGEDHTYSIPKLRYLRPAFVRTLSSLTQEDAVFAILDEFGLDLVDKFDDMEQVVALYTAWMEASGVSLGESSGSSASSTITEEPSTETSSSPDGASAAETTTATSVPTA